MKRFCWAVAFLIAPASSSTAQQHSYVISGVFTDILLGSPHPSVSIGSPFTATFDYHLPGTTVVLDGGIGWYAFSPNEASGSAMLGLQHYSTAGGAILVWHEGPGFSSLILEGLSGDLTFRTVLSTTDTSSLDVARIPGSLNFEQFDYRRAFQVFGGGVSAIGRIESLTVVPEPHAIGLAGAGLLLMFYWRYATRKG